ncbi:MAG: RNB domain-containing ribonuclease, partial [Flavobacteriaceae bacterium]|nr:RNB domain-containing ribonuclease [Flavobacteriaceae bacterium]
MSRKKKNTSAKSSNLTNTILGILKKGKHQTFNYKQIAAKIGVDDASSRNQIIKKLKELKEKKEIEEVERGKYKAILTTQYYTGILDISARGSGYIISPDFDEDVFVSSNNINRALDEDEVEFYVYKRKKQGRYEGEITDVIKRAHKDYVGVIHIHKNYAFVVPDSQKMYTDIFVTKSKINKAEDGDKVLVSFDGWPEKDDSPHGRVIKVLGKPGEHHTEIHSILAEYGLPAEFPQQVEDFANNIDTSITEKEINKRRDMRKDLTFTIDPKDAKDFDDALSFKEVEKGVYEIGIHIADVSHYLKPDTILDEEAYNRGTSVYLVDRVVPMLPEILSNNACSLRPNEEKYTFSAVFKINDQAKVLSQWFGRTVTYSDARFAYEEAQAIIESKTNNIPEEVSLTGSAYHTKQ